MQNTIHFLIDEFASLGPSVNIEDRKENVECIECHNTFEKSLPYVNGYPPLRIHICPDCIEKIKHQFSKL